MDMHLETENIGSGVSRETIVNMKYPILTDENYRARIDPR